MLMHVGHDPEADACYTRFAPERAEVAETREVAPSVTLDPDADGNLVGIEVPGIRRRAPGQLGAAHKAAAE